MIFEKLKKRTQTALSKHGIATDADLKARLNAGTLKDLPGVGGAMVNEVEAAVSLAIAGTSKPVEMAANVPTVKRKGHMMVFGGRRRTFGKRERES